MPQNVTQDRLVIIRIEGLHCHRCEETIRTALNRETGVNEVEVDFLSGQCSVLFDASAVSIGRLIEIIHATGYKTAGHVSNETIA